MVVFGVPATALAIDYVISYTRRECFPTLIDLAIDFDLAEPSHQRVAFRQLARRLRVLVPFLRPANTAGLAKEEKNMEEQMVDETLFFSLEFTFCDLTVKEGFDEAALGPLGLRIEHQYIHVSIQTS